MALTKSYTDYAVALHTKTAQSGAAVYVDGIQPSPGLNSQLQTEVVAGDGSVYNTFGALNSGAPAATFETVDLKAFLDQCGTTGMLIDADETHPGAVIYFPKRVIGGALASGASHWTATIANGILVPRTLEMSHQQSATISAEALAIKSGSTAPVTFDEAVSLPESVYPSVGDIWTLGNVDLNGTQLQGVTSVSIDFGIELITQAGDSDIYPTFVGLQKIQPRITIQSAHIDITSVVTEDGLGYNASEVILYARHRTEGGTVVADVTETHVAFSLGKVRVDWESVGSDPKEISLSLQPYYTAGESPVTPITVDTTAAIS